MVHKEPAPHSLSSAVITPNSPPRGGCCTMQPPPSTVAIEHATPNTIKRIRLVTRTDSNYSGSSSSIDTSPGLGAGGTYAGAAVPSPASSCSLPVSAPYLFDLYDLPVNKGEKQVVDQHYDPTLHIKKPQFIRTFSTEMAEQTAYDDQSSHAEAAATAAAGSSAGPAFDTVNRTVCPSPPSSPSFHSSPSSFFQLYDWSSSEALAHWNAFIEQANQIHQINYHHHAQQTQDHDQTSHDSMQVEDSHSLHQQHNIPPPHVDIPRSTSGTMHSIFHPDDDGYSMSDQDVPSDLALLSPYPQFQVAPSPAELPIGQLARYLSTGGKELRVEQQAQLNQLHTQIKKEKQDPTTQIQQTPTVGLHTRRGSGIRGGSLSGRGIVTKSGRKRKSVSSYSPSSPFAEPVVSMKNEQAETSQSILPALQLSHPSPSVTPLVLGTSTTIVSIDSASTSTSILPPSNSPATSPRKRQKKSHLLPSPLMQSNKVKGQKDRHVKTAKKLKTTEEGGLSNQVEVVAIYYHRPISVLSSTPSSLVAEPVTASTPPATNVYKIRLITVENILDGSVDVYGHGADIGGLVERKSNISRLFGKFDSPSEKLLMNVIGSHNHTVGQESNILTQKGIMRFIRTPKMRDQEHYKRFLVNELIPKMKELTKGPTRTGHIGARTAAVAEGIHSATAVSAVSNKSLSDTTSSAGHPVKIESSHPHSMADYPTSVVADTMSPAPSTPISPGSEVDDGDVSDLSSVASTDSSIHTDGGMIGAGTPASSANPYSIPIGPFAGSFSPFHL